MPRFVLGLSMNIDYSHGYDKMNGKLRNRHGGFEKMAFCDKCGKDLRDGAKFCDGCGAVREQPGQNNPAEQLNPDSGKTETVYSPTKKPKNRKLRYAVIAFVIVVVVAAAITIDAYFPWLKMNDEQRISACKNAMESSKSFVENYAKNSKSSNDSGVINDISFHESFQGSGNLQSIQTYCGNEPPDNQWDSKPGVRVFAKTGKYSISGFAKDKNKTRIEITGDFAKK
jgi:hypothetical protein